MIKKTEKKCKGEIPGGDINVYIFAVFYVGKQKISKSNIEMHEMPKVYSEQTKKLKTVNKKLTEK